jgi:hypothetical protein
MFAIRIPNAALALAGAALVATTLMTTIASAAPAESLPRPADGEAVAADLQLDWPHADIAVVALSQSGPVYSQEFTFRVTNFGPEAAYVHMRKIAVMTAGNGNSSPKISTHGRVLQPGQSEVVKVHCEPPDGGKCFGAEVSTMFRGTDPYPGNNAAGMATSD